ncbi:hypothetical protein [Microbacterium sp.]|uniref:hypothetical protein n=1 Tax=Microbacterium sp. TaxID=51671 RepID=UPI0039E5931D
MSRRCALLAALAASALLLAGCTSSPAPETTATASSPSTATAQATPTPTASTAASEAAVPTCDELVAPEVTEATAAQGWTVREEPFVVGGVEIDHGISCTWADYSNATGNLLTFAWGSISAANATKAQRALESAGWLREKTDAGVYITEDPATAMTTDADGYGLTYLFGDGWVTFSDTRQGLLLIHRPGA